MMPTKTARDPYRYLPASVDVRVEATRHYPASVVTLHPGLVDLRRWPELADHGMRLDDARVPRDIVLLAAQHRAAE